MRTFPSVRRRAAPLLLFLLAALPLAAQEPPIVPRPASVEMREGSFPLTPGTKVAYYFADRETKFAADFLARGLRALTGYRIPLVDAGKLPKENFIFLNYTREESWGSEGYGIESTPTNVELAANDAHGFLYAVQSLLQMLPPRKNAGPWSIPCCSIVDTPRFAWRGMHLDVSRHFFPVKFIYTYIEMLAMHKLNVFHWHLTDDQGWRIEIKKYPLLTKTGAWRVDREQEHWNARSAPKPGEKAAYGGFYTQKQIRKIVRYAAARNVTIVPEIEMPAHSLAALAAYPRYSCTGGPFPVAPGGVWPDKDIFCAGKDSTFLFLENILSEVIGLFPGTYMHIGGDEADKREWKRCPRCQARMKAEHLRDENELQSWFVKRIEKFLVSKGRRLIGWDEILEGGLAPEATVMSWRGVAGGIAAARQGHDAVMTPGTHCYFDHYQGRPDLEPLAIGGYTPLSKVYAYEPIPDSLTAAEARHILGAQANLWTEYVPTPEHAQYMALPRMAALAEAVWSIEPRRDWGDFSARLPLLLDRYEAGGWNYARSAYTVGYTILYDSTRREVSVGLGNELKSKDLRYSIETISGSTPPAPYTEPIQLRESAKIRAVAYRDGRPFSKESEQRIRLHKALFMPVSVAYPPVRYLAGGVQSLVDGVEGSLSFSDGTWLGFQKKDFVATVDLGRSTEFRSVAAEFLEDTQSWIFFPRSVEFSVSEDGMNFSSLGIRSDTAAARIRPPSSRLVSSEPRSVRGRYVRISAQNVGVCPPWHPGAGGDAWLFVDEIVVE